MSIKGKKSFKKIKLFTAFCKSIFAEYIAKRDHAYKYCFTIERLTSSKVELHLLKRIYTLNHHLF